MNRLTDNNECNRSETETREVRRLRNPMDGNLPLIDCDDGSVR